MCMNVEQCIDLSQSLPPLVLRALISCNYFSLCGCFKLCVNSAERNILSPLVILCMWVCACMHNVSDGEHVSTLTSILCSQRLWGPLVSGKPVRASFLNMLWFFSGVSVSLSFLLCVFKWMGSKNPNIRSSLPHLPLSFYQLLISLSLFSDSVTLSAVGFTVLGTVPTNRFQHASS